MGLDPARAAIRLAIRRELGADPGRVLMVACSGGADSLALLAATVFEAGRHPGLRVIGVVVDHGLQDSSAEHTARVVAQMASLGADETASIRVTVDPGPVGIEAAAREARYAALSQLADHFGAGTVLLGHTLDDQAETVLLGLTRGSGGRSLQGMRPGFRRDDAGSLFVRPLLGLRRADTEAACRADGIEWWEDPHNTDARFTRSRIRHTVLPMLEDELGPGVAEALARTAEQMRADMDLIDALADELYAEAVEDGALVVDELDESVDFSLVTRVVRRAALEAGAIASELTRDHVLAVLRIFEAPGKEIQLPGHVTAYSDGELVRFRATGSAHD